MHIPVFLLLRSVLQRKHRHWAQKMWRLLIGRSLNSQVLGDTFQFWQILTDREQLQPAPKPVLRAPHARCTQARAPEQLSRTYARRAAAFHARWRNPKTGDFLKRKRSWLWASWKPCRKLDESEQWEYLPRIMWEIGLRNDERGLCRGETGDDDSGWQ